MSWWGKVIGGAIGLTMGPLGAVFGAAVGHLFDRGLDSLDLARPELDDVERIKVAFFTATFSVLGHVAKADGKVTNDEIKLASSVMDRMELTPEKRKFAQDLFRQGKQADFPLDDILDQFRQECHWGKHLLQMFLEIQLSMVLADGVLHPAESEVLYHIAARLGYSRLELDALIARLRAETEYSHYYQDGAYEQYDSDYSQPNSQTSARTLELAYQVLGVSSQADDDEVKRAYRRLMNQHHPDKLVSKGLPEEMMEVAKKKSQEITAAYQTIKKARGI